MGFAWGSVTEPAGLEEGVGGVCVCVCGVGCAHGNTRGTHTVGRCACARTRVSNAWPDVTLTDVSQPAWVLPSPPVGPTRTRVRGASCSSSVSLAPSSSGLRHSHRCHRSQVDVGVAPVLLLLVCLFCFISCLWTRAWTCRTEAESIKGRSFDPRLIDGSAPRVSARANRSRARSRAGGAETVARKWREM